MSKELKVEDLSPKAREELNNLCNKLKKGDNTGQLLSRKDQMFYLEGKIINQIYSVIEQCPIDKLKEFWSSIYNGKPPEDQSQIFTEIEQFLDICSNKQLVKLNELCVGKTDLNEGFMSIISAKEIDLSKR